MKNLRLSCSCGGDLEAEMLSQAELEGFYSLMVLFFQNHECKFSPHPPLMGHQLTSSGTVQQFHPLDPEGH